jgi:PPK2 family polyphosphate:nucleotide phosphotransferase
MVTSSISLAMGIGIMVQGHRFSESKFVVERGSQLNLSERSTRAGKELRDKAHAAEELAADVSSLRMAQQLLYASNTRSLLVILQGMDTAGKDGTIRHVMSGVNPQGCRVYAFKAPNSTELEHHFLTRPVPCLPARGMISLFNRSYYEEVLVVRVHPEFLIPQKLPKLKSLKPKSLEKLWQLRFKEINAFERALAQQGTLILKFYLHLSPEEQKERLLERLNEPEKFWKFNPGDLEERKLWSVYQHAFEEALTHTSTKWAPWYVIPADDKWYARAAIADIIAARLEGLDLQYPTIAEEQQSQFADFIRQLQEEA